MDDTVEIPSPLGLLRLRPECEDDLAFRFRLFCDSRAPEFAMMLGQVGAAAVASRP